MKNVTIDFIKDDIEVQLTDEMISDLINFEPEDIQSTEEEKVKELSINKEDVIKRWKELGLLKGLELTEKNNYNSMSIDIEPMKENEQPLVITNYISWLEKRIMVTEKELIRIKKANKELNDDTKLNLIIGKGAKLKTYKECLYYIRVHS
jgi:hypothetical protein